MDKRATLYLEPHTRQLLNVGENRSARANGIFSRYIEIIRKHVPMLGIDEWWCIIQCNRDLDDTADVTRQVYRNLLDAPPEHDNLINIVRGMGFLERCAVAEIAMQGQKLESMDELEGYFILCSVKPRRSRRGYKERFRC
jgi:hypothetical protein